MAKIFDLIAPYKFSTWYFIYWTFECKINIYSHHITYLSGIIRKEHIS